MQFKKTYLEELGATIELTAFAPEGKTAEWHAMLQCREPAVTGVGVESTSD